MTADEIECIEEGGTEPTVVLLRRLAAALSPSVTHLTTASVYIRRYARQLCRGLDCLDCMPNGRSCARPRLVVTRHREEEQEISMICLQIPQSCLGYINRLMIQDMLAEPEWADRLGLTPLFTVNMTPYGEIQLNLDHRLNLATDGAPST